MRRLPDDLWLRQSALPGIDLNEAHQLNLVQNVFPGYQENDREIVDYELFQLEGIPRSWRGPQPSTLERGRYFACVGAAQTFGRFCADPYPALLSERIRLPVLNLGVAGAGPRFFNLRPAVLALISGARFAVVQVMSGRSEDNRLIDSGGLEYVSRLSDGKQSGASNFYGELLRQGDQRLVEDIVRETRDNWVGSMRLLLGTLRVPTVLLWFSKRTPDYKLAYGNVAKLFGEFPHLIDRATLERVKGFADYYVECVTSRGAPQVLLSRFTGHVVAVAGRPDLGGTMRTENTYYPSPEMHVDAADCLEATCLRLAG